MPQDDRIEQLKLQTDCISEDVAFRLYNNKRALTKSEATLVVTEFQNGIEAVERELEEIPAGQRNSAFQHLRSKLNDLRTECIELFKRIERWSTARPGKGMKCGF